MMIAAIQQLQLATAAVAVVAVGLALPSSAAFELGPEAGPPRPPPPRQRAIPRLLRVSTGSVAVKGTCRAQSS